MTADKMLGPCHGQTQLDTVDISCRDTVDGPVLLSREQQEREWAGEESSLTQSTPRAATLWVAELAWTRLDEDPRPSAALWAKIDAPCSAAPWASPDLPMTCKRRLQM